MEKLNKIAFTRDFKNFIGEMVMNHFEERVELSGQITGENYKEI
jgi:hypothetical protein